MKPVKQIDIKPDMKVSELINEMQQSGVMGAGRIGRAAEIMQKMFSDKDCKVFFGFAGAMVPGGMKNIIIDLLKKDKIDVFVTTGANLTHDLIEALGFHHYKNESKENDEELNKKGLDRIYDTLMQSEVYQKLEDFFDKHFKELSKEKLNIKEFLWKLGSLVESDNSILKTCYEKKIPIFCPAISDSGIGLMIWNHIAKGDKIEVDTFDDLKEILDISWTSKKSGVIYIGGGVPKNYIQQAMQLTKGASYGIQITTDRPESGGSSGAPLQEGISWGKMNPKADFVDVICDATIAFPLIISAFNL